MELRRKPTRADARWFALRVRSGAEWLRLGITAGLSLAIVVQAALASYRLWTLARPSSPHRPVKVTPPFTPRPQLALQDLVAAHLFGKVPDAPQEAPAATSEHWVLSGTLHGATPASGAAILGPTAATTRYYAVGEEVPGGFRLTQVFADRVTIERAGERRSLELPRKPTGRWDGTGQQLASAAAEPLPAPPARDHQPTLSEYAQNNPIARRALMPMLQRGASGHWEGMRVRSLDAGDYGLQRGDVIREVDGHAIDSAQAQGEALQTLSQRGPVTVTVERSGELFTLEVNLSQSGS